MSDFDLIAANIPAKAGEPAIAHFLRGAAGTLRPGGRVAIVVVSRIEAMVEGILDDPAIEVVWRKPWPGHTVFHYRFTAAPGPSPTLDGGSDDLSSYRHGSVAVTAAGRRLSLHTAASLPEAEAMDVQTELAIAALGNRRGTLAPRCLFFNPGQGYVPVAAHRLAEGGRHGVHLGVALDAQRGGQLSDQRAVGLEPVALKFFAGEVGQAAEAEDELDHGAGSRSFLRK